MSCLRNAEAVNAKTGFCKCLARNYCRTASSRCFLWGHSFPTTFSLWLTSLILSTNLLYKFSNSAPSQKWPGKLHASLLPASGGTGDFDYFRVHFQIANLHRLLVVHLEDLPWLIRDVEPALFLQTVESRIHLASNFTAHKRFSHVGPLRLYFHPGLVILTLRGLPAPPLSTSAPSCLPFAYLSQPQHGQLFCVATSINHSFLVLSAAVDSFNKFIADIFLPEYISMTSSSRPTANTPATSSQPTASTASASSSPHASGCGVPRTGLPCTSRQFIAPSPLICPSTGTLHPDTIHTRRDLAEFPGGHTSDSVTPSPAI